MKIIKYRISIVILCFLFSSALIINNKLTNEINQHILMQEDATANIKPVSEYNLSDALKEIYKYDNLTVEKINLELQNSCGIELKYKGSVDILQNILTDLSGLKQVNHIGEILVDNNDNIAKFNITFTLY